MVGWVAPTPYDLALIEHQADHVIDGPPALMMSGPRAFDPICSALARPRVCIPWQIFARLRPPLVFAIASAMAWSRVEGASVLLVVETAVLVLVVLLLAVTVVVPPPPQPAAMKAAMRSTGNKIGP